MGELGRRLERIKITRFVDALEVVFPEIDIPGHFPARVRCLLPGHPDRTPSFDLKWDGWRCWGCGKHGDIVDFAEAYYECDLREAVAIVEAALGFSDGKDADLQALIALARRRRAQRYLTRKGWEELITEVELEFSRRVRSYLLGPDPLIQDLAWRDADYVYEELGFACTEDLATTERGARQRIRRLRTWAQEWAEGIERFTLRATGRDPLDVHAAMIMLRRQRAS